ncbi:MAG: hypothetical protein QOJ76_2940 [Acidobacteriota bacterium]|jgi:hypothetical protein|nr:hypothetical protein [Acidobacteriota bacterium]
MLPRVFSPALLYRRQRLEIARRLRLKLLIIASLLASAAGATASFALTHFLLAPVNGVSPFGWTVALTLLAPLGAVIYAAVFVYRHTARRRATQAAATALLATLLTLTALALGSVLDRRHPPEVIPAPPAKTT